MEGKNRGPSPRPLGVYGQILLGFGAFTLVIAALLWVFQIFLLGPFYQLIKTDQVENTAEAVLRQLDEPQDTLRQTVEDLCYDTDINILVIDENGRLLADSYASQKQSPLRIALAQGGLPAQTILAQLYNEVNLQGGRLEEKFPLGQGDSSPQVVLYGRIQRTAGGEALMVLLETEITPVDSTVETLKVQLLCLTLVMAVLGLGLALFIARRIARPLAAINQSAKKLGEGDYAIRFEGAGTREAAELAQAGVPGFGKLSSCAKIAASDAAVAVTCDALQVFSGYGYMKDYPLERMYRDARGMWLEEGPRTVQRLTLVRDIIARDGEMRHGNYC